MNELSDILERFCDETFLLTNVSFDFKRLKSLVKKLKRNYSVVVDGVLKLIFKGDCKVRVL